MGKPAQYMGHDSSEELPSDASPPRAPPPTATPFEYRPLNVEYNVVGDPIDTSNMMPLAPNQIPGEGQTKSLPTSREPSSIPKGGADGKTWQYPSEQMFYNALRRKNKAEDVDEDDVKTIVKIHNNMNEKTWNRVREWEALHKAECEDEPKLSRFRGRPDDLSPKAWLRAYIFSSYKFRQFPFDRHDWYVDRCGKQVRYVIDYYHDDNVSVFDEIPKDKHDNESVKSIEIVARPALDSPMALFDRFRMPVLTFFNRQPKLEPLTYSASKAATEDVPQPDTYVPSPVNFDSTDAATMKGYSQTIQSRCKPVHEALRNCGDDASACRKLSVSMFHCMASVVCPQRAKDYEVDVASEGKFDAIVDCMSKFEQHAAVTFGKKE